MREKQIIIAWELGAGMGHTGRLRPLVERFLASGAQVFCLAIRAADAACYLPCPVQEAPWLKAPERERPIAWAGHLADTLTALGWSQADHLRASAERWRAVLSERQPDLLVMDSAPTAMLASLGLGFKTAWLANHWSTPPRVRPIPDLQERIIGKKRSIPDTEPLVVNAINAYLVEKNQSPIAHLYELFNRADASPMLSIPEIDPHGPRADTNYLGIWGSRFGAAPPWPPCIYGPDTPGIFAYLKPFANRAATLKLLAQTGLPVLAYTSDVNDREAESARGGAVHLFTRPIDWLALASNMAFMICHGGAGMTGQALQMGLPVLALPTSLEQTAVAMRATESGAAIAASINDIASIGKAIENMLTDESILDQADKIAQHYASYDPQAAAFQLADRLLGMIQPEQPGDA